MGNEQHEEIPELEERNRILLLLNPTLKKCIQPGCEELGTVQVCLTGEEVPEVHCAGCAFSWAKMAQLMCWQHSVRPVPGHGPGLQLFWLVEAVKQG